MSLQKITHIKGLDRFHDFSLNQDDDDPWSVRVRFTVVDEEMPFLTNQSGRRITQSFVYIEKSSELGQLEQRRRIKDVVEYDNDAGEWKITLTGIEAGKKKSDILEYPDAWNMFNSGQSVNFIGTPLEVLFRGDPGRAEFFKKQGIHSVEHLAGVNETDAGNLGMSAKDDRKRAIEFIRQTKEAGPILELQQEAEKNRTLIMNLQARLEETQNQLMQVLKDRLEEPVAEVKRSPGRPKKVEHRAGV